MNADKSDSAKRYDIEIDPTAENTSHAKVLGLVGSARTVLDIGCASGYLAKVLQMRGARVVGVEIDPSLAAAARAYCEKVIVGDLEALDLAKELQGERFDAVICADVLEHLANPSRTLRQVRSLLGPDGFLVASIPNITHISVTLELLKGNFDYRPLGLLDETHRRFFSKRGVIHLFEQSGYWVSELDRTYAAPHRMEIAQPLNQFGPELARYVESQDEAVTYQFVLKALPCSESSQLERVRAELEDLRSAQSLLEPAILQREMEALASQAHDARAELDAIRHERDAVRQELQSTQTTLADEMRRARDDIRRVHEMVAPLRRVWHAVRPITAFVELLRSWFEGLTQRTYRPRLVPIQELRPRAVDGFDWESTGDDPQFRLEPPLPNGWVRLHLKGRAKPAAVVMLYVDDGKQAGELTGHRLGTLSTTGNSLELFVGLSHACFARLDPSLEPCQFAIEEFSLQRIGSWRIALRTAAIYLGLNRERHVWHLAMGAVRVLRRSGFTGLRNSVVGLLQYQQGSAPQYPLWVEQNRLDEAATARLQATVEACSYKPTISVLMPVYNPPVRLLKRAIESVRSQLYSRWELCIADDASTSSGIRPLLERYASIEPRIKVVFRDRNGHIAAASNSALSLATGDFVALLDHDDELSSDALLQSVLVLNEHPDADLLYSDEDKINESGSRKDPHFKPDWSPETLLANMYIGHLSVYRRSIVQEVGGFRVGTEGSQDYDLALRVTEKTCRIHHIPRVLYHWRITSGSAAAAMNAKPYAYRAAIDALSEALARRAIAGTVESHRHFPDRYVVHLAADPSQKVSIVIPTRDQAALLERCLQSVFDLTTHPNFEVCVVDNGSREQATFEVFEHFGRLREGRFRVIRRDLPFNFSALVNAGVVETDGPLVLLLNNDTEVLDGSWLEEMAGYARQREIGAVGCVLVYPDGAVQHGGVILMEGAVAGHSHSRESSKQPGHFGRLLAQSNYAAVTAACMMVRRELLAEVGGFDERLGVAFNDVDFCLRLLQRGYRNVCLGQVRLLHHESKSRGYEDSPEKRARFARESALMRQRWAPILDHDPYYNPNMRSIPPDFAPRIM
ncbi:MAG: glycosyltransferase [Chloroflexi bacterium]|nr:MAG: glycosyltransferase [Chloroflexota bacterium]